MCEQSCWHRQGKTTFSLFQEAAEQGSRREEEKKLNGLEGCISTPTNHRFFKAMKWNNDQIKHTSTIPVL
jgi:hypothetical protein